MSCGVRTFDLNEFLPYCLNRAAEEVSLGFQEVYRKRYGMTRPEWRVLAHLGQFGSMTASEISARSRIHKTKVSRAVYALEKRRWLIRRPDDVDRRVEHLELTRKGAAKLREIGEAATEYDRDLRSRLSCEEGNALMAALTKLSKPEVPSSTIRKGRNRFS
jgi:DNA-binding MarR family transcriptional regulator